MNRRRFIGSAALAGLWTRWAGRIGEAGGAVPSKRSTSQAIQEQVHEDEVLDFCKEILKIPSFTTEETEVAEFIHSFFRKEGFESQLQEVDPGRFQVIARLPGSGWWQEPHV